MSGQHEDVTKVIPGNRAVHVHPFADLADTASPLTVFTRGEGAYVYTAEGRRLIDGVAGLWCVNIGHGRREMAAAIARQAEQLAYYSTFTTNTHPRVEEFAERLADVAPPGLGHAFFSSSGSAANDTAIRIAHHYFNRLGQPQRKMVITRDRAYHGSTFLATILTRVFREPLWDYELGFVKALSCPDPYRRPREMSIETFCDEAVAELERCILELGPENVAAFIAEPIMGAGGVIVPPPGYQRRTWETCRKYGVLYISDEVVTAFGRLGHLFASRDLFGIEPDLITCAKGITSGYVPLAATLISDKVMEVLRRPGSRFATGFTYSGHPVACAAALENLRIFEREKLCERVRRTGPAFQSALQGVANEELVGEVRGSHFMMAIELVADKSTRRSFNRDLYVSGIVARHCFEMGLVARAVLPEVLLLSPTLILTEAEITATADILRESLRRTAADLVQSGHR